MRNALYYKSDGTLQVLEGYYVDDRGYIFKGGKEVEIMYNGNGGYYYITVNSERKFIHRIVASTFCDVCGDVKEEVHHIDFTKSNNKPENLLWLTKTEHRVLHNKDLGRIRRNSKSKLDKKTLKEKIFSEHLLRSEKLPGVIYQYSKQGELVKMWKDLSLIKNYLGDNAYEKIKKYLGTNRSVFGYIWHIG